MNCAHLRYCNTIRIIRHSSFLFMKRIFTLLAILITCRATAQWSAMAPLPTAEAQHAAVAHPNGNIYVIAGYDGLPGSTGGENGTLQIYNTGTNTWTAGTPCPHTSRGASYCLGTDGKVYLISGISSNTYLTNVYRYDVGTAAWTAVANIPVPTWEAGAASYGGKIYVAGGASSSGFSQMQIYDIATNTWSAGAALPVGTFQHKLVSAGNGTLYLLGGSTSVTTYSANIYKYTISTNTWSGVVATLPDARNQFGATMANDGKIYLVAGKKAYLNGTAPFYNTTWIFNPANNSIANGTALPASLGENTLVSLNSRIYSMGGTSGTALSYNYSMPIISLQGPANVVTGIKLWLKGDSVSYPAANPANGTTVTTWKDVSGNSSDATVLAGQSGGVMNSAAIGGKDVIKFNRTDQYNGSIYNVANVDIRSQTMPQTTIFTVYRQGTASPGEAHGIWGDDNTGWDRFFMPYYGNTNGIVSVGLPTAYVAVPDAGIAGQTKLLTAVYDHGVTNGSTIYFNALPVQSITDNTDPTDAQTSLRIGWDGDDNAFNGDIAEMIVYDRKLTDCEIKDVNRYLGYKYGVSLTTATVTPAGTTGFCSGGNTTLTSSAGTTYQWLKNGVAIPSAANATYTANTTGNYKVVVGNASGCTDTSLATVVIQYPNPTATILSTPYLCAGDSVQLSAKDFSDTTATLNSGNGAGAIVPCNCPPGYVAVGYSGVSGNIVDQWRLGCRKLVNGVLDTAVVYTNINGNASGSFAQGPFLFPGNYTVMVGDSLRKDNGYLYSTSGFGQGIGYIAALGSNTATASRISLPTMAGGGWTGNSALGNLFAADGRVITGMYGNSNTYSSRVAFRTMPISEIINQYQWTGGNTTQSVYIKNPGTYTLTLTSGLGCTANSQVTITTQPTDILYVDSAIASSGTGFSWLSPLKTVSEALAIANRYTCFNQIYVKKGTYYPMAGNAIAASRDSSFRILRNGVRLYGGFAGTESSYTTRTNISGNTTILSGDIGVVNDSTDNSYHVMTIVAAPGTTIDSTTTVDGFKITRSYANNNSLFNINGQSISSQDGGGLHISGLGTGTKTTVRITNCIFTRNSSNNFGGAIYNTGTNGNCSPIITACTFSGNTSTVNGGAIFAQDNCAFRLSGCSFTGNTAYQAGAVFCNVSVNSGFKITGCQFTANTGGLNSGAISVQYADSTSLITDCTFTNNLVTIYDGGGIYTDNGSKVNITKCRFLNNTAGFGGGFACHTSGPTLRDCVFSGNTATQRGGAVHTDFSGAPVLLNCLFVNNNAPVSGGAINYTSSGAGTVITNCTIYNNTSPSGGAVYNGSPATQVSGSNNIMWGNSTGVANSGSTATFTYSDIQGGYAGASNIAVYPLFLTPSSPIGADGIWATADDGLHLIPGSSAANAGTNSAPFLPAADITGVARIQGGTADMGAYESPFTCNSGIVYVDSSRSAAGDGTSWATAFNNLSQGLAVAHLCPAVTQVWVARGTYYPMVGFEVSTSRDSSFRITRNGLKVYGGFAGNESTLAVRTNITGNPTILSGNIGMASDSADNVYHVVTIVTGTGTIDTNTRLDGFTVTEGAGGLSGSGAITVSGLGFNRQDGGGIYIGAGNNGVCSPTIANCTVTKNAANFAGGLYCNAYSTATANCSPVISRCLFSQNRAISGGGAMLLNGNPGIIKMAISNTQFNNNFTTNGAGGAVNSNGNVTTYSNCSFTANTASTNGGGISLTNDTVAFSNCAFTGNISSTTGGTITSSAASLLTITNSSFTNNTALGNTSGGAIYTTGQSNISQSTFTNNTSFAGGAIANYGGGKLMTINGCVFNNNSSSTSGGALISEFQASIIVNGSRFNGNVSGGNGGVLYSQNDSLVTMNNDTCINNRCTGNGGAVMNNGNPAVISNSVFIGNRAGSTGGGVFFSNLSRITGCIFQQDTANSGGGIYANNSSNFYSARNVFDRNIAVTSTGGGINASNSQDSIINCVFYGNRTLTVNGGGGIFYSGNTTAYNSFITNNTFYADTASSGGAIRAGGGNLGTLGIYNNISWKNSAGSTPFFSNATAGTVVTISNNYETPDPIFINESNPRGADNTWGTADDGLRLSNCSPAINTGLNAAVPANVITDIAGAVRIQQTFVDAGAYESAATPVVITKSHTNILCNGAATGSITLNVTGGSNSFTYSWSPSGGTGATATGLTAGIYTATVTDASGCSITVIDTLTQPGDIMTSISSQTNILCFGNSTGAATIGVTGGTGAYTYSWAPAGGTAASATGLAAGIYTVTVKDANNCTKTQTVNITQPAVLATSVSSQTNVACNGSATGAATIAVTGGTVPYTYSWSPSGGSAATATNLAAGTYTVTVKDANNCTTTQTVNITQSGALTTSVSAQTNVLCKGAATGAATIAVSGGSTPYTYSWAPAGGTAASATGLLAGNYTVTVKDANNCSTTQTVTITEPAAAIATSVSAQTNVLCFGNTTGAATVAVTGGTGTYTYSWAPSGGSAASASGLAAGTYTVTVKDANNCVKTQTVTITQPASGLTAAITSQTNVLCFGNNTGSATVTPSGGTSPYTYSWSPSGGTAATASGLAAGTYTVTVKDAGNCTATATVTITQPAAGLAATAGSQTNILCNGAATGAATVAVTGGTSPYTYSWSPSGGTAATATGLAAGTYTVTVKDAGNCTATQAFTITQPPAIVTSVTAQTSVACFGGSTGSATIGVTGGTGAYTYSWAPSGGTAATATGLAAGNYTVTVKDANNCTTTQAVTVTQPAAALSVTASSPARICAGAPLNLTAAPAGGTTPYAYSWTGPNGFTAATQNPSIAVAQVSMGGTYSLTVTDARSCTANATTATIVDSIPNQPANITGNGVVCGGSINAYSIAAVTGATSYTWTLPAAPAGWTGSSATTSLSATAPATPGTGTLSVAAVNGCGSSTPRTLSVAVVTTPAAPAAVSGSAAVCGGITQSYFTAPVDQATSYLWTVPAGWSAPAITGSSIATTPPVTTGTGNGAVTVKASNVCGTSAAASLAVTVTNIPAQPAAIAGNANVCGGTAQIYKIPKVAEAAAYTWTVPGNGWTVAPGSATDTFINTTAGTAANTVSVTASNQCGTSPVRTLAVSVTNVPGTAGAITGPDSVCTGSGAVTFATGQIAEAASYTWTLPPGWTGTSATSQISGTPGSAAATGAVTVKVTGTNSCGNGPSAQKTIIVNNPVTPAVALSGPSGTQCAGNALVWTATPSGGGLSPLYQWKVNGVNQGAPGLSNTFTSSALNTGDVVSVQMRTSLPCATTPGGYALASAGAVTISPQVMPGININATAPPDLCKDVPVTFYANTTGGGSAPVYRWSRNGTVITGATGPSYTLTGPANGDTLQVTLISNARCRITDSVASNKMGLSVSPYVSPVVSISANPGTAIGAGQTVIFTAAVANAGANPEVRWKRNGLAVAGTTGLSWTTSTLRDGDVISADLVSGARCATPFMVTSVNTLQMRVSTGVSTVSGPVGSISLYPNPSSGAFTVQVKGTALSNGRGRIGLEVLSATGQLVWQLVVAPDTRDWSVDVHLPAATAPGMYLIRIAPQDNPGNNTVLKFNVEK